MRGWEDKELGGSADNGITTDVHENDVHKNRCSNR